MGEWSITLPLYVATKQRNADTVEYEPLTSVFMQYKTGHTSDHKNNNKYCFPHIYSLGLDLASMLKHNLTIQSE
jgi:hypothetical protein